MPIHLDDVDIVSEAAGLGSALIVPCNFCPAVTVAMRKRRPFIQFFKSLLKSVPFDQHIKALQSRLREKGVQTEVFKSMLPHHFVLCIWSAGRRRKLRKYAERYDAIVVLGCDSATETVRGAVQTTDCKVIQGMEVVGFMNAVPRFHWPCNISFEHGKIIPLPTQDSGEEKAG